MVVLFDAKKKQSILGVKKLIGVLGGKNNKLLTWVTFMGIKGVGQTGVARSA